VRRECSVGWKESQNTTTCHKKHDSARRIVSCLEVMGRRFESTHKRSRCLDLLHPIIVSKTILTVRGGCRSMGGCCHTCGLLRVTHLGCSTWHLRRHRHVLRERREGHQRGSLNGARTVTAGESLGGATYLTPPSSHRHVVTHRSVSRPLSSPVNYSLLIFHLFILNFCV
jgi:hypothetical protein